MKKKQAPIYDVEPVIHHHHYHKPPHADLSSSGLWIFAGCLFALLAIPFALIIDISSKNSGGRAIAAIKGFILAVGIFILLSLLGSNSVDQFWAGFWSGFSSV